MPHPPRSALHTLAVSAALGLAAGPLATDRAESPPAPWKAILWNDACWSRSSSSACAIAERKSTSHSVGARS